jgi:ABC-type Fe3+ transport system permease subunit
MRVMSYETGERAAGPPAGERTTGGRSALGSLVLVLTILSIIAFIVLAIGSIAEWKGFSEDENDNSTFADVVWSTFALGGLLALILGIVAWVRGRARALAGDVRAGQTAVAWVVVAIVLSFIVSALE